MSVALATALLASGTAFVFPLTVPYRGGASRMSIMKPSKPLLVKFTSFTSVGEVWQLRGEPGAGGDGEGDGGDVLAPILSMSNDAIKEELLGRGIEGKGDKRRLAEMLRDEMLREASAQNEQIRESEGSGGGGGGGDGERRQESDGSHHGGGFQDNLEG